MPQTLQVCAVVQVAAGPGICPAAAEMTAPQTVQTWSSVHVASGPRICPLAGILRVRVAWQRLQVLVSMPVSVHVAGVVSMYAPQSWPSAGTVSCTVNMVLQREQWLPSVRPVSVHVAGTAGSVTGLWPNASTLRVCVAWQRLQVLVSSPAVVQPGAIVCTYSPQL